MTKVEKEIMSLLLKNRIKMELIMEVLREIYSIIGKDKLNIDQIEKDIENKVKQEFFY